MAAAMIRLLRPADWVKNLFVLPALVFSLPRLLAGDAEAEVGRLVGGTALAFACFCLLASGFYAINDVIDAEKDRRHPIKRKRPVASGAVSGPQAIGIGVVLIAVAIGLGWTVNLTLVAILGAYGLLQIAYNLGIKRVMLVDVVALATGFALRAAAGAAAIRVQMSVWLILCVFFLCLYLGFIKRLCDLSSAAAAGDGEWKSPAGYEDRIELNWLLGISAALAIVTYLMYALSDHAWALFGSRAMGFALLSPLVMITIHRFYRRASFGRSDSPLAALVQDRVVAICVVLFGVGVLMSLYVPAVQQLLERLFVFREAGSF
jgi:4-hydroxybenzoate polyprenyltransferase